MALFRLSDRTRFTTVWDCLREVNSHVVGKLVMIDVFDASDVAMTESVMPGVQMLTTAPIGEGTFVIKGILVRSVLLCVFS
jgi:hypothetical protein